MPDASLLYFTTISPIFPSSPPPKSNISVNLSPPSDQYTVPKSPPHAPSSDGIHARLPFPPTGPKSITTPISHLQRPDARSLRLPLNRLAIVLLRCMHSRSRDRFPLRRLEITGQRYMDVLFRPGLPDGRGDPVVVCGSQGGSVADRWQCKSARRNNAV